jgi:hypothetical protein
MPKQLLRQSVSVVLSFFVVILLFGHFRDRLVAATIEYRCIKWTWVGDVYNRRVICLKWERIEKK